MIGLLAKGGVKRLTVPRRGELTPTDGSCQNSGKGGVERLTVEGGVN